jgi:glutathione S-transferase
MPMERTRCAKTTNRRTTRSPDRTAVGRPATERTDEAHQMAWCAPTMSGIHPVRTRRISLTRLRAASTRWQASARNSSPRANGIVVRSA